MEKEFKEQLRSLLNKYGYDTASDTPDYLLAEMLESYLQTFVAKVKQRDAWWGFRPKVGGRSTLDQQSQTT